ncbi:MAG: hypothetical protein V2I36_11870 [Desulfopila sp.]|nr:hypothetical protein [Desulfopila sp.]
MTDQVQISDNENRQGERKNLVFYLHVLMMPRGRRCWGMLSLFQPEG